MAEGNIFDKVRKWFGLKQKKKEQIDQQRGLPAKNQRPWLSTSSDIYGDSYGGGSNNYQSGGDFSSLQRKYNDYKEMDAYPTLSAALDMYADEATKNDFFRNRKVWVEGDNENVVSDLNFLFEDQIKVDDWSWEAIRYLAKTGNNYERMFVSPKGEGVIATEPLPAEKTRRVHDEKGQLAGFIVGNTSTGNMNSQRFKDLIDKRKKDGPKTASAHLAGGQGLAFEDWEVSHFRLKGKNRIAKYGESIMESSRWVFRRLVMMEDAVVVHKLCLRGDSDIWTPSGYKKIKNIERGDEVYCFGKDKKLKKTKVNYKAHNGKDDIYHVKSEHRDLYANKTHPVLCRVEENHGSGYPVTHRYEYVQVQDLEPNKHEFVTPKVSENDGEEIDLTFNVKEDWGGVTDINLPDKVTPDFARLFGFMVGGGFIMEHHNSNTNCTSYSVGFAIGDDGEVNKYYKHLFESFVGKVNKRGGNGHRIGKYSVYSEGLYRFMKLNGFVPGSHNKRVPEWVFRAKSHVQWEFLQGLFDADAHYQPPNIDENDRDRIARWTLEICNEALLEDVRHLSMQLGLRTTRVRHRECEGGYAIGDEDRAMPPTESYTVSVSRKKQNISEPIKSIEKVGEDDIYDIGVEHEVHNFIANGVCVKNSRAPSRNVFYVDTGKMPPLKALEYTKKVKDEFKKKKIIDKNGNLNMGYDPTALDEDFYIPVHLDRGESVRVENLSGADYQCLTGDTEVILEDDRVEKIKDLVEEDVFAVHSINPENGLPEITKGMNARPTKVDKVWRVELSNDNYFEASKDHPVLTFEGKFKEVQHLEENERLMPELGSIDSKILAVDKVVETDREEQLYDLEVSTVHNYILNCGAVVHNSVEDVDYFRKKMGRGLKIPNFGQDDRVQSQPLTQEDYRFASAVQRLQGAFTTGLQKIADVHLVATHRSPKDYKYSVKMTPPSSIIELARVEVLSAKADILSRLEQHVSIRWLLVNVFGFSEEEAVNLMVMRQEEIDMVSAADVERELARSKREAEMFGESKEDVLKQKLISPQKKAVLKEDKGAYGITEKEYTQGQDNISPEKFLKEVAEKDEELFERLDDLDKKLDDLESLSKFKHLH